MDYLNQLWNPTQKEEGERLANPGTFENLHRECKGVLPTLGFFDGAKVEATSVLSPFFQVSHSFSWASTAAPPGYQFGAALSGDRGLLYGVMDNTGALQGRANYHWIPVPAPVPSADGSAPTKAPTPPPVTSTTKFQGQLTGAQNVIVFEHELIGQEFSASMKATNPSIVPVNPRSASSTYTGTYGVALMKAISKSLSVGAEIVHQRPNPTASEDHLTLAFKYAPRSSPLPSPPLLPAGMPSPYMPINPNDPTSVLTASYMPTVGILHSSYYRRINQRLELATELQALLSPSTVAAPGKRDAIASLGFKLDTVYATIRAMGNTHGILTAMVEEKIAPGLSFTMTGEIDYSKGAAGKVGLGFTMEM